MRATLRIIGIFGTAMFVAMFALTFASTERIEASAKGFVKYQIAREVRDQQQAITQSSVVERVSRVAESLGLEKESIQQKLDNKLPEKIAAILASMCGYDCEKKKSIAQSISSSYLERIKNIQIAQNTLADIVKNKYLNIIDQLKRDLRTFFGTNGFMFLVLLVISLARPQATTHLFLPALLLLAATAAASAIYLFGQDWFYTILYNDYMGLAYLAYIAVIFAVLLDIALNKARISSAIINFFGHALGGLSVGPC